MANGDIMIRPMAPPEKLRCLFDDEFMEQWEYIILEGGRGGGKTETLAQKLVIQTFSDPDDILCVREVMNSIADSVYKVIEDWIDQLDLRKYFLLLKTEIINKETGARFIFRGMTGSNATSSIKSLKGVKYVWYEEAQTAMKVSIDVLLPTIRVEGRKFYFSMNPESESDCVPLMIGKYSNCLRIKINYYDNQYCPQVLIRQAEECKELFPQEYDHIWLGKPLSDGDRQTIVTSELLYHCIDAHKELGHTIGHAYGGLDLSAGELKRNDKNALAISQGNVVKYCEEWRSGNLEMVADLTTSTCQAMDCVRLYYDAVGVGGFAGKQLMSTNPTYGVEAYMGQHSPMGGKKAYIRSGGSKITNEQQFANLKAQMWWNVRLRAENTLRLLRGFSSARPDYYLSLSSEIPNIEGLIQELSQATWKENNAGRIIVDKSPADYKVVIDNKTTTMRSPNRADALASSFLRSCRGGLKINR